MATIRLCAAVVDNVVASPPIEPGRFDLNSHKHSLHIKDKVVR